MFANHSSRFFSIFQGRILLAFVTLFTATYAIGYVVPAFAQPSPAVEGQQPPQGMEGMEGTGETTSNTENAAAPAEETEAPQKETIWIFLKKGGPTMIALGIISTIILAFALERAFFFQRQKIGTKGFYDKVISDLNEGGVDAVEKSLAFDNRLLARIFRNALFYKDEGFERVEKAIETEASVELGKLEKGLNLLNNLGNLAPLVGFFGTVTGMRNSFLQFVEKAAPTARDLAGGVEEALITTITGLLIAIPAYFIYNMFIYYIDSLSVELERNASAILSRLKK